MTSFLSESYPKPKLIETHIVNKIIDEQNNKITFEKKVISYFSIFFIQYWKIIISLLIIISLFYWRYKEIQNIRKNKKKFNKYYNNKKYLESESESESVSDSDY